MGFCVGGRDGGSDGGREGDLVGKNENDGGDVHVGLSEGYPVGDVVGMLEVDGLCDGDIVGWDVGSTEGELDELGRSDGVLLKACEGGAVVTGDDGVICAWHTGLASAINASTTRANFEPLLLLHRGKT